MGKEKIEALIEGGKATAAPPIGSSLGPLGVNIGQVVEEINKKTEAFKGMKVPIKIIVDTTTKEFQIEVGTPPISQLIKKELNLEKGSGEPNKNIIGNIAIEQIIKIAKMKKDSMLVKNLKAAVKNVIGSCNAMGILVEGKKGKEAIKEIDNGNYDKEISTEKTQLTPEKAKKIQEQLTIIQEEYKKELERIKSEEEKLKAEEEEEKIEKEGEEKKEVVKEEEKPKEEKKEEKPTKEK